MHFSLVLISLYFALENTVYELLNFLYIVDLFLKNDYTYPFAYWSMFQHSKMNLLVSVVYKLDQLLLYFFIDYLKVSYKCIISSFSNNNIYLNCFNLRCASFKPSGKHIIFYMVILYFHKETKMCLFLQCKICSNFLGLLG